MCSKTQWGIVLILGSLLAICNARDPFKVKSTSMNFLVYFSSRYRGICVGTLVSRSAVLTAAVCVASPLANTDDTRPITVVTGTSYRHPRRGIRIPITKIIKRKMPPDVAHRAFQLEHTAALMLMKKKVPDALTEKPLRAIEINFKTMEGEEKEKLALHEECLLTGWHFHYEGDHIYPVHKFLLQRNLRAQFVNIVKMDEWCDALHIKLMKTLANIGYHDGLEDSSMICSRDPDFKAQACHGMYGAPLICRGRAVGMLMAPDAQWTNCTGHSNIIHLFDSKYLRPFFDCVSKVFETQSHVDWDALKKAVYDEFQEEYDFVPAMYDKIVFHASSSSSEN